MPIIAVAVAVVADVGAGVAAIAGTLTTLEAVAAVGATLGAIGTITGNKDLALAGGVLGGIGAIGSLASSAGLFGGPDTLFGTGATTSATSSGLGAIDPAANVTAAAAGTGGRDIVDSLGAITNPAENLTAAVSGAGALPSISGVANAVSSAVAPSAPAGDGGLINSGQSAGSITPATSVTGAANWTAGVVVKPVVEDTSKSTSLLGKIGDALTTPTGVIGLLSAGGALISGWASTLTPAQVEDLNAKAAANRAAATLATQQQANIAAPKATVTSAPVTGSPAPLIPGAAPGLINVAMSAQPQAPQVMA